jgi:hypothetical protein
LKRANVTGLGPEKGAGIFGLGGAKRLLSNP